MAEEEQQPKRVSRPRPESTIAQNFAADLDSMFGLGEVDDLSRTIEEKKYTVSSGQQQLQELEARLRETEQRLAKVSRQSSPAPRGDNADSKPYTNGIHTSEGPATRPSPLAQKPTYPADRPPTADRPPSKRADTDKLAASIPGALQPSPSPHYHSNNDYIMVDRNGAQAQRGYG
ncbi:hypothetical protein CBER1_00658 [Cercospora berteroae]|uniref:Uncharacterized protein n=1 Tax=Cercospora berteroae TaxID=357750 RepID=A0A2S6C9G6_9PEZI|nr:hypothetical protein CBER1_00658 [Cercospora berteroae]